MTMPETSDLKNRVRIVTAAALFDGHDAAINIMRRLMQREGGVEELQHAVDYLMNSSYVTGRILPMDGGRHIKAA